MQQNETLVVIIDGGLGGISIVFNLSELKEWKRLLDHAITLGDLLEYVIYARAAQKEEIPLRVSLFSAYIHPIEHFAVRVNGNYANLDEVIIEKEPKEFNSQSNGKRFNVYDITFMITHCDGGYESRTKGVERILPHPAPQRPDQIELYYKLKNKWENTVESYKNELEGKCCSLTTQFSIR